MIRPSPRRAHGDLSENAEYHAAREQQGFIEGRIQEIEAKMSTAEIIDPATLPKTGKVVFGAVVELEDQDSGAQVNYQIVGEDEADLRAGRISITSPIARALIAKSRRRYRGCHDPGWHQVLRDRCGQGVKVRPSGSGMMSPGLPSLLRYRTATCPMRCTSVLPVRLARAANIRIPRGPIGPGGAHLDELVIVQRAGGFRRHRIGQALAADLDGGFKGMCAAAQKAALIFG